MKKILILATFLLLNITVATTPAQAYEIQEVCAKYESSNGWSKGYSVQAKIYDSNELNEAVGSFNRYGYFDHYAVIFWSYGQASVIKLSNHLGGKIMFSSTGRDQSGRQWQLQDNSFGFCY